MTIATKGIITQVF